MIRAAWLLLAVGISLAAAFARADADSAIDARWERWSLDFDSPGTVPKVERTGHLVPGERGEAFRSGARGDGAQLFLSAVGRIDLTTPGALIFSVSPETWRRDSSGEYIPFLAVQGRSGSYFVVERDRPSRDSRDERLLAGFWGLRGSFDASLAVPLSPAWEPLRWHTLALSWDTTGFGISVDGGEFVWRAVPAGILSETFSPAESLIVIGSPGAETTRIDSIRVFSRPITAALRQ